MRMRLAQNNKCVEKHFTASNTRCSNANCKTTLRQLLSSHRLMINDLDKSGKKSILAIFKQTTFAKKFIKWHFNFFIVLFLKKILCRFEKKIAHIASIV